MTTRSMAGTLCALQVAALCAGRFAPDTAFGWAARLISASIAVLVVPGGVLCLYVLPLARRSPLECAAMSVGFGIGIVQAFTVGSLLLHVPVSDAALLLVVGSAAGALAYAWRGGSARLRLSGGERVVASALLLVGGAMYVVGVPRLGGEDYVHVGIIRRLAALAAPSLNNIYMFPDVIYTYPFPGTHYLLAMISRIGDVDPLFVYSKTRFLWAPLALLFVWSGARVMFGSRRAALASTTAAFVLTFTGSFASVQNFAEWGQLVPSTHASDIALGVFLPAVIVLMLNYISAPTRREAFWLLTASLALVATLVIVHIREVVQLLVYLAAFALAVVLARRSRELKRTAILVTGVLVFTWAYLSWYGVTVVHVDTLVTQFRTDLVSVVQSGTSLDLIRPASARLSAFIPFESTLFWAVMPYVLVATPLVLWPFRRRSLVWFVGASIFAYLVILRVMIVAAAYIYLTYFEILFSPARNFAFFVHVIAGVMLYVVARRLPWIRQGYLVSLAGCLLGLALVPWSGSLIERYPDLLFIPSAAGIGTVLWLSVHPPRNRGHSRPYPQSSRRLVSRTGSVALALATIVVVLLVGLAATWQMSASLAHRVHVRWRPGVAEIDRTALERRFALVDAVQDSDPSGRTWVYELLDESRTNIAELVQAQEVEDTYDIDPERFRVAVTAPEGQRLRWVGQRLPLIHELEGVQRAALVLAALLVMALWWHASGRLPRRVLPAWVDGVRLRETLVYACGLAVLVLWGSHPEASPLATGSGPSTPDALLATFQCEEDSGKLSCPPSRDLMQWAGSHIPVDAVLAVNIQNMYPPVLFFPYQFVAWGGLGGAYMGTPQLFDDYLRLHRVAESQERGQPLFNDRETAAERRAFVDELGVTHVLVDPAFYGTVTIALSQAPDDFEKLYDGDRWAVFAVRRQASGD